MNDTKSMGLRLPVQGAVDRTPAYGALGDGTGVEAQGFWDDLGTVLGGIAKQVGPQVGTWLGGLLGG
jgi:hypothetical protein